MGALKEPLLEKEGGAEDIGFDEDKAKPQDDTPFTFNTVGLTSQEAARLLEVHGPNMLPEKKDPKWLIFVRQLWQPMPRMIWLASLIEFLIQNYIDMSILIFINF